MGTIGLEHLRHRHLRTRLDVNLKCIEFEHETNDKYITTLFTPHPANRRAPGPPRPDRIEKPRGAAVPVVACSTSHSCQ